MRCMNPKVLAGLVGVAVVTALVAPSVVGSAAPALLMLVCPISMMLMMRSIGAKQTNEGEASAPLTNRDSTGVEVISLRAEVDQLRAELRDRREAPIADPS